MEISNTLANYRISIERIRNTLLESLRNGQIVQAKAVTSSEQMQVQLRIGKLEIVAHTSAKIAAGDDLTLQVVKAANPLQLKIVKEVDARRIEAEVMRSVLPQQASIGLLMKRLNGLSVVQTGQPGTPSQPAQPPGNQSAPTPPPSPSTPIAMNLAGSGDTQRAPVPVSTNTAPPAGIQQQSPTNVNVSTKTAADLRPLIDTLFKTTDGVKLIETINRLAAFQLTSADRLSPERVRWVFENSGLFMESTLAHSSTAPNDLKQGILELLLRIRPLMAAAQSFQQPAPLPGERGFDLAGLFSELHSQAEGSLARIVFNQLSSLPSENTNQQVWQFELPLRQGENCDAFRVQIERQSRRTAAGKAETLWSVKLNFELEPIGPVQARLVLTGDEISSHFTAEYSATAQRLEQALPALAQAFSRSGLKVGKLSAVSGAIESAPRPRFPLLDERA